MRNFLDAGGTYSEAQSMTQEDRWKTYRPAPDSESLMKLAKGESFQLEGKTYVIQKVFSYTERKRFFSGDSSTEFEVYCAETDETRFLEVEKGSRVVWFTDVAELTLADVGIADGDQLEQIVDSESSVQGFAYEDDYDARFEFDGEKEDLWSVEFKRGNEWLCVEEWEEDESYEVSKGRVLSVEAFGI